MITKEISQQLNRIERNSLLASKSILNLDDVSLLTGFSKSTLYKMTRKMEIPHYKPRGKQLFFEKAEIEQWMMSNKVTKNEGQ